MDMDFNDTYLVFVNDTGKTTDGKNRYDFLFAKDPSLTFGEKWTVLPIGICRNQDKLPSEETYDFINSIETNIELILGKDNKCVSYMSVQDKIVAVAWENIENYEEYPEYRLVFHYGESYDEIVKKLSQKDIKFGNVNQKFEKKMSSL
jgi:hypothetical protein